MATTPNDVLQMIAEQQVEFVDLRFMDFPGSWQHKVYHAREISGATFEEGKGFDGSCVRGWEQVNESDMLLVPVASTATIDPFCDRKTLAMICDIKDPVTKKQFSRDPRSIARKAEHYLKKSGVADAAMFSPEIEFFVFDRVRFGQSINEGFYEVDSIEGEWNQQSQHPANLGTQLRRNEGLFPSPPADTLSDLRSEMAIQLEAMQVAVESHHHEVATGGQCEIDLEQLPLLGMADAVMVYKYVVKQVAARHGRSATFMPKPLYGDNGSGMHTFLSLWKKDKPLFAGRHYGGLSQMALHAIGGILHHSRALIALTNPTTNSFKRLVPGYEAPVHLVYSSRNRWAAIRVPTYSADPASRRLEIRFPDGSSNPYLAFSALLMAALDGIQKQIDPGDPLDKQVTDITADELGVAAPESLDEALEALEADHEFLLEGDVFTPELIKYWIQHKRLSEVEALRQRPHPYEFCMYYDI
jgi:glutamine synthetase